MTDAELIKLHGGPKRLAQKMNLSGRYAVQRIQNWKTRGIPAKVKLQHPSLFLGAVFQNLGGSVASASESLAEATAHG